MANKKPKVLTVTFEDGNSYTIRGLSDSELSKLQNALVASDIAGKLDSTLKGVANGLAELDANGKVPSSQLPTYSNATQSADGLMSSSDKSKLDGIQSGAQVNPGVATTSANGLMSSSDKSKLNGIANNANNYSLPLSASGTRGGIQIGYSQNGKNYPVQLSSEKAYVNVPWTDTNTWRGIQNSLSSDSTTESLSAAKGKKLYSLINNSSGGYMTKSNYISTSTAEAVQIGRIVFFWGSFYMASDVTSRGKALFTMPTGIYLKEGSGFIVAIPLNRTDGPAPLEFAYTSISSGNGTAARLYANEWYSIMGYCVAHFDIST